ncbi:MAG: PKD domain-containing protein [Bacteroidetes bacterium]|nr:PKD domain-containing protein [Bacteroidota bacterium]
MFLSACFGKTSAQVFWTEDFATGCNQNQNVASYTGVNGAWTMSLPSANGTSANDWFISATEAGMGIGNCGDGCLNNAALTNRTLHVGSAPVGFPCATGDCGAAYYVGPSAGAAITDKRAESPTINCTGQNNITMAFAYMESGQIPTDEATVWYFDGVSWAQIAVPTATNNAGCAGQGKWTAFSVALPASANNNANVKIGFRWVNNDDGAGNDPSFAADDITLSAAAAGPPVAAFTASSTNVCVGQAVNFTDNSTGAPTSWAWTFPSGTPPSSTLQNPSGITWAAAGTYTVTLTATNSNGSNSTTQVITVNGLPTITASAFPSTICVGQQSTLTGGGGSTYLWNPGAIPGSPVNVSPAATTTYTVTGTSAAGCSNTATVTVTVQPCNVPQVNFIASDSSICVGDCINFTDQSTNTPTSWSWTFSGAVTATSTAQNPTSICYNSPGTFAVTLIATNSNGNGSLTKTGYIVVNPAPTANAGTNATICTGQSTTLIGSGGTSYNWQPGNGSTANFFVTPASTTTYTLTVTDANGCTGTDFVTITVNTCSVPTAALTISNANICEGTCINFTDNSAGTPTSWNWSFPGATPASSTVQNPTGICYNTPGNYNVTLIVTNAFGSDTLTMVNAVSVGTQPTVNAGAYVTIAIGNSTQLSATGGAGSYSWSPPTGLSDANIPNPVASPTVTTTYTVTFTDANGCTATDTVTVNVEVAYAIFIPTAFSPNGDGSNDVLYVRGAGIKLLDFVVYDRFGEKVFESMKIDDGWDGSFRGEPMNSGIYVYYVKADFYNNTSQVLKGDVSLVR